MFHNAENDHMRWLIITSYQSVYAEFGQGVIHTESNTVFAAVLYLSPDAPLKPLCLNLIKALMMKSTTGV